MQTKRLCLFASHVVACCFVEHPHPNRNTDNKYPNPLVVILIAFVLTETRVCKQAALRGFGQVCQCTLACLRLQADAPTAAGDHDCDDIVIEVHETKWWQKNTEVGTCASTLYARVLQSHGTSGRLSS